MFRNLNCPIISCLWVKIMMVAVLMTPLFRCLANLSQPPQKYLKSKIFAKNLTLQLLQTGDPAKTPSTYNTNPIGREA